MKTKNFKPHPGLAFLFQDFQSLARAIDMFGETTTGAHVEREIRAHAKDTLDFAGVRCTTNRFSLEVSEVEEHFRLRVKEYLTQAPQAVTPKMIIHNRPLALIIWAVAEELRPHLSEMSGQWRYEKTP